MQKLVLSWRRVINQCLNVDTETCSNFERITQSVLKLTLDNPTSWTIETERVGTRSLSLRLRYFGAKYSEPVCNDNVR